MNITMVQSLLICNVERIPTIKDLIKRLVNVPLFYLNCGFGPFRDVLLCQKMFKIQCETDIRRFTYPARGSTLWKKLYKECTAVEHVNAHLKQTFQLNDVRHRTTGRKAKLHFNLVTFIYNACKLAVACMNALLQAEQQVA